MVLGVGRDGALDCTDPVGDGERILLGLVAIVTTVSNQSVVKVLRPDHS